ncbi:MAG: hypothetical protein DRJ10_00885 [Bacteroidetes bacterium]|nr:MAG: hypothetical protein DRJ10_00885 [Bacteroidota bacterium]
MSIALSGIITVQLLWIRNAIEQNEHKFDQKVNDALLMVIKKLEHNEIAHVFENEMDNNKLLHRDVNISINGQADSLFIVSINDTLVQELIVLNENPKNRLHWVSSDENTLFINGSHKNTRSITTQIKTKNNSKAKSYIFTSSYSYQKGDTLNRILIEKKKIKTKAKKIENVIKKMVFEYDMDINRFRKRIKFELLDSLLKLELTENDIHISYEYGIKSKQKQDENKTESDNYSPDNSYKKYYASLFPDDLIPKPDKLVLYFPDRESHLYSSLSIMLPASLFFSLIILVAFSISVLMVLKQKKISDVKTDFINNMTHELKTPIATISLAADSIINPKVINNPNKINNFIRIIKDENTRMNKQVESVLQMSLLDKSDFGLNLKKLDIHILLENAIENTGIQIDKKNGQLSTDLRAKKHFAMLDEIHFLNIINNLLDNSLKYSGQNPVIKIKTRDAQNSILISVEDNGIGMTKEEQLKIFDRFYRVTKGNIHNTKGFGLGLSYVKAIIDAFKGNISVKSELGKGSRFDVFIPSKM